MTIQAIKTVFFSPTKTSQKIAQAISEGFSTSHLTEHINLTPPDYTEKIQLSSDELAIIAVPVYAGRVAPVAKERLQNISGDNSPAILVVLYGNREYEDALIELKDIAESQSFRVIAAAAFIGEHSFSTEDQPTAHGRPDEKDLSMAREFGKKVQHTLDTNSVGEIQIPGNRPYRDGMPNLPFTPHVLEENCTQCEECISVCPTGAIALTDTIQINPESCTFCCACIKTCPESCISLGETPMAEKAEWLHTNYSVRKEPEFFI